MESVEHAAIMMTNTQVNESVRNEIKHLMMTNLNLSIKKKMTIYDIGAWRKFTSLGVGIKMTITSVGS